MTTDQIQRLRELAARATPCSDHGCVFGHPGGQGTNGGCKCLLRPTGDRQVYVRELVKAAAALLDELERLRERDRVERIHQARLAELQREVDDYRAAERPSDWERGL